MDISFLKFKKFKQKSLYQNFYLKTISNFFYSVGSIYSELYLENQNKLTKKPTFYFSTFKNFKLYLEMVDEYFLFLFFKKNNLSCNLESNENIAIFQNLLRLIQILCLSNIEKSLFIYKILNLKKFSLYDRPKLSKIFSGW